MTPRPQLNNFSRDTVTEGGAQEGGELEAGCAGGELEGGAHDGGEAPDPPLQRGRGAGRPCVPGSPPVRGTGGVRGGLASRQGGNPDRPANPNAAAGPTEGGAHDGYSQKRSYLSIYIFWQRSKNHLISFQKALKS
jgi:hypothetical protein